MHRGEGSGSAAGELPRSHAVDLVRASGNPHRGAWIFLHAGSDRRTAPFLATEMATTAEALDPAAFLGDAPAGTTRGIFELTAGGTLVIGELTDLSDEVQQLLIEILRSAAATT